MIACLRCGSPVDQRVVFCGICGQSRVGSPPAPAAPQPRAAIHPGIAMLLVFILVIAVATAAFVMGRAVSDPPAPVAATVAPSATPQGLSPAAPASAPAAAPATPPLAAPAPVVPVEPVRARCTVIDDSGTPLNIRASPNGRILGGLLYGQTVEVVGVRLASNGRYWSRINGNNPAGRAGWVSSALLACVPVTG